ncbi:MAG: hypothetical protein ACRDQ0_05130 [Pseudonocardia sp.]
MLDTTILILRADLLIAATAMSAGLPLYTTNPEDYRGLEELVEIVRVTRPAQATP